MKNIWRDGAVKYHKCDFFTHEYAEIYLHKEDGWHIDIDSEAAAKIFFCPFCGKSTQELDKEDTQ